MNTRTARDIRIIHLRREENCRIEDLRLFREPGNDMSTLTKGAGENPRALFSSGYESIETLAYNPVTDKYSATGAAGRWQGRHFAASVTGENIFSMYRQKL